jgi:hypothetical protein
VGNVEHVAVNVLRADGKLGKLGQSAAPQDGQVGWIVRADIVDPLPFFFREGVKPNCKNCELPGTTRRLEQAIRIGVVAGWTGGCDVADTLLISAVRRSAGAVINIAFRKVVPVQPP